MPRPCPDLSAADFRECLEELERRVSEASDEVAQLEGYVTGITSVDELLGHCLALWVEPGAGEEHRMGRRGPILDVQRVV